MAIIKTLLRSRAIFWAPRIAPLAPGVEDGEAVGKARRDFGREETREACLAHVSAAEQQVGHDPRLLRAAALQSRLGVSARIECAISKAISGIESARMTSRNRCYPLTRSIAAPQAPSLSSSRSKPRSR